MSEPTMKVTADFTQDFNDIVKRFKKDAVLVGIPEEKTDRTKGEDQGPITNAALLAINDLGSPINNIPARPVMQIGIRNAQDEITQAFREGTVNAFSKGLAALSTAYNRVGIIASNSIKKAINAQEGFEGPSAATLASREARGFKGTKSLIVTGQMRNAITYVVKGEE